MEEVKDELEPLFDYSRIQPIDFVYVDDECSISSPCFPAKRKRDSDPSLMERKAEGSEVVIVDEGEKEEEDWLPPPPKKPVGAAGVELERDPTIQELRLKKQELASFTQSAEDVVRAVEEAVKRELGCSGKSFMETEPKHPSKPSDERAKIVISIQDKDGGVKQFRIFVDETFDRLFKMYSEKVSQKIEVLVFCFDGDKISPTMTPESLGMEDGDIIEVHVKSS